MDADRITPLYTNDTIKVFVRVANGGPLVNLGVCFMLDGPPACQALSLAQNENRTVGFPVTLPAMPGTYRGNAGVTTTDARHMERNVTFALAVRAPLRVGETLTLPWLSLALVSASSATDCADGGGLDMRFIFDVTLTNGSQDIMAEAPGAGHLASQAIVGVREHETGASYSKAVCGSSRTAPVVTISAVDKYHSGSYTGRPAYLARFDLGKGVAG